jgi:alkanesulfonate monooxygenase SsuD/methylene tetrahydromethanopterin reductase-like flavin-dependent oxidoreductase (luciferase family)
VLKFAIFDHLDSNGTALGPFIEERLRLLEHIEVSGFHAFQLAEHHSTPLGMAFSPSVFLSAAIQRTRKIRLGPLVYVLPLHHPLRLYEEICMLDHMSGGRLIVGGAAAARCSSISALASIPIPRRRCITRPSPC